MKLGRLGKNLTSDYTSERARLVADVRRAPLAWAASCQRLMDDGMHIDDFRDVARVLGSDFELIVERLSPESRGKILDVVTDFDAEPTSLLLGVQVLRMVAQEVVRQEQAAASEVVVRQVQLCLQGTSRQAIRRAFVAGDDEQRLAILKASPISSSKTLLPTIASEQSDALLALIDEPLVVEETFLVSFEHLLSKVELGIEGERNAEDAALSALIEMRPSVSKEAIV